MTGCSARLAEVVTLATPSLITTAKLTAPWRFSAGVKVQVPSWLSTSTPSAGSTLTLCTLSTSPASGSLALASNSAAVRTYATSSVPAASVTGPLTLGASLLLPMLRLKSALALRLPSVAVMRRLRLPTSALPGVPLKVCVAGSKLSQPGSGLPSARLAL
ncbi:hypothetical protein D3C80_1212640 [compost metagenome]